MQSIVLKTVEELHTTTNLEPGTVAYVEDDKCIKVWNGEKWENALTDGNGVSLNLYDLNRQLINQLDPLTEAELTACKMILIDYYKQAHNNYHMLLCKDYNYYTLFALPNHNEFNEMSAPAFADNVYNIINTLGSVYSVEQLIDGAVEIWIKPNEEEMPYAFYLFGYDRGVVYYG
jgi:hypothetical protein